ncbi:Anaphase-promoting complex subunit 2 [Nymphaea thermarum]|nr:Anaphase-promoting complex subunit 2 [Nymphaea thermarum]
MRTKGEAIENNERGRRRKKREERREREIRRAYLNAAAQHRRRSRRLHLRRRCSFHLLLHCVDLLPVKRESDEEGDAEENKEEESSRRTLHAGGFGSGIDPTGVFLEAVSEPIRDYLRGRKDTIKCIVNMLTDGTGGGTNGSGGAGDSLLEELNRNVDNLEISDHDNDFNSDDKQAWADAQSWEPDPIEADPLKGVQNGKKVDILGMLVSIIGSKDQLVNQYHIMLAEKLLNKLDYDIDSEIRTLELLKLSLAEIEKNDEHVINKQHTKGEEETHDIRGKPREEVKNHGEALT